MVTPQNKRIYQVFVSSTYEDLKLERQEVMSAIVSTGNVPIGMEYFPAGNASPFDYIKKQIDNADYYILVLAGKYGTINDDTGFSYTEMEYDYAIATHVPVASFVIKDPMYLITDKYESKDPQRREKLEAFRRKVCNGHMVKFWEDVKDLRSDIKEAIHHLIEDSPRDGWIKYTSEINYITKQEDKIELERLKVENLKLKNQIQSIEKTKSIGDLVIIDSNFKVQFVTNYDIQIQLDFSVATKSKPVTIKEILLCNKDGVTGSMGNEQTRLKFDRVLPGSIIDIERLTTKEFNKMGKQCLATKGIGIQGIHIIEGDVKFYTLVTEFLTVRNPDGYDDLPLHNWSLQVTYNIDGVCEQPLDMIVIR